jgi:hypothetical protein
LVVISFVDQSVLVEPAFIEPPHEHLNIETVLRLEVFTPDLVVFAMFQPGQENVGIVRGFLAHAVDPARVASLSSASRRRSQRVASGSIADISSCGCRFGRGGSGAAGTHGHGVVSGGAVPYRACAAARSDRRGQRGKWVEARVRRQARQYTVCLAEERAESSCGISAVIKSYSKIRSLQSALGLRGRRRGKVVRAMRCRACSAGFIQNFFR